MAIRTALTELLGIEHPLLLALMAGICGGALAAAVSNAGGLGLIGGGYGDRARLEGELAAAGNARVGICFITWALARQPELLDRPMQVRGIGAICQQSQRCLKRARNVKGQAAPIHDHGRVDR